MIVESVWRKALCLQKHQCVCEWMPCPSCVFLVSVHLALRFVCAYVCVCVTTSLLLLLLLLLLILLLLLLLMPAPPHPHLNPVSSVRLSISSPQLIQHQKERNLNLCSQKHKYWDETWSCLPRETFILLHTHTPGWVRHEKSPASSGGPPRDVISEKIWTGVNGERRMILLSYLSCAMNCTYDV